MKRFITVTKLAHQSDKDTDRRLLINLDRVKYIVPNNIRESGCVIIWIKEDWAENLEIEESFDEISSIINNLEK